MKALAVGCSIAVLIVFALPMLLYPPVAASEVPAAGVGVLTAAPSANYAYRNYTQIKNALLAIEAQHPDIAKLYDIGDSYEKLRGLADRDILAMKISDNVQTDEDEPEIMILGLHHAREWTTSELVLELAVNLTDAYGNDTRTSWLVDNREVWIVPIVNPDGLDYALKYDQWWRKNRRLNYDGSYGVDLNRNYMGSMNGDPDGNWGGAGASHVPSDETYCGQVPFSELETQAVRKLVIEHNFQLAIDFHSYQELVLWPWGYTANVTPDDADLVRIGNKFAALNGYKPQQSVGLYPTTGDSIDWMYGGEDIYAFCFEVGLQFHPTSESDVLAIIDENMAPAILGIEIAGDREERPFEISHVPMSSRNFSEGGFGLVANISAARGVNASALELHYRVGGGLWSETPLSLLSGNDTYAGIVPSQSVGSRVDYYFVAHDVSAVELMSPRYAPYEFHSFNVTARDTSSPLEVEFAPPGSVDGSFATVITAQAANVSSGYGLVLHMRNASLSVWENMSMTESPPGSYSATIPALMPLAEYDLFLTVESGGVVEWSSGVSTLTVRDETPPAILDHTPLQVDATSLRLDVNCSDAYGVVAVAVTYREKGSTTSQTSAMTLASGDDRNGTWSATIPISGTAVIEYNFTAQDVNKTVTDPADGSMHEFVPVIVPEFSSLAIAIGLASILIAVVAVSRARRS